MSESYNHFPAITKAMHKALSQAVRKCAFDIQALAQTKSPVDTGFLKNSIYVRTSEESTYGQGGAPPKKDSYLMPEVEKPEDDLTAYVAVGANYGMYLEFGTRFQPAQPYFLPAVEEARPGFEAALSAIEAKIKESVR